MAHLLLYAPPHPTYGFLCAMEEAAMPVLEPRVVFINRKRFVPALYNIHRKITPATNIPHAEVTALVFAPIAAEVRTALRA